MTSAILGIHSASESSRRTCECLWQKNQIETAEKKIDTVKIEKGSSPQTRSLPTLLKFATVLLEACTTRAKIMTSKIPTLLPTLLREKLQHRMDAATEAE
jgi:hypothetical protein